MRARLLWVRALKLRHELRIEAPSDPAARRDEAVSLANLGGLELNCGRLDTAEQALRQAAAGLGPLAAESALAEDRALLGRCYYNLSLSLARRRRFYEAEALALRAVEIQQTLAAARPDQTEFQEDLARSYCSLGHALAATQRIAPSEAAFEEARAIREALVAAAPEMPQYRDGLVRVHLELAQLLRDHGRHAESVAAYRSALEHQPDCAVASNDLAWELARLPDRSPEEIEQSVDYAARAVAARPMVGAFWNTLGLARYRAGKWEEAAAALRRSMELSGGGNGFDWYLLALTLERQGDHQAALEWFARADRWMSEQPAPDADLNALRDEAERALTMSGGRAPRGTPPTRPAAPPRPLDLALEPTGATSLPAQVPCRSGLGLGPSSIPAPILQRSTFAL
jgi:tetratricopeptide (TPR) repeat protein